MKSESHNHKGEVKSHKFASATRIIRMLLKDYNREILHSLLKLLRFSQKIEMDFTTTSGQLRIWKLDRRGSNTKHRLQCKSNFQVEENCLISERWLYQVYQGLSQTQISERSLNVRADYS